MKGVKLIFVICLSCVYTKFKKRGIKMVTLGDVSSLDLFRYPVIYNGSIYFLLI